VLKIRKFEPNDMFSVIKLASDSLPERYNPSIFNYFYETFPDGFIVAETLQKLVGFIVGVQTHENKANILMLSVSEYYQNRKIGTELLKEFLKIISNLNIKIIELEVRTDNEKAISFYKKHNFKIKKKIEEFYQNGEDAFTMALVLQS
jgi:ribosomal-protein-alanine N-acetyltransferase